MPGIYAGTCAQKSLAPTLHKFQAHIPGREDLFCDLDIVANPTTANVSIDEPPDSVNVGRRCPGRLEAWPVQPHRFSAVIY